MCVSGKWRCSAKSQCNAHPSFPKYVKTLSEATSGIAWFNDSSPLNPTSYLIPGIPLLKLACPERTPKHDFTSCNNAASVLHLCVPGFY